MDVACNIPRRPRCSVFGHVTEGCAAFCRHYGEDHAIVNYTKPCFYSAIAHGDAPVVSSAEDGPASASLTVTETAALPQSPTESDPTLELQQALPAQLEIRSTSATASAPEESASASEVAPVVLQDADVM